MRSRALTLLALALLAGAFAVMRDADGVAHHHSAAWYAPRTAGEPAPSGRNGSTEALTAEARHAPLTPPVVELDLEPAPRSAVTSEPLIPPIIEVKEQPPAPRGGHADGPLSPPVVEASAR